MKKKITLHCLISMLQITNLYDKYESNDWIFRCSQIGVILQKFCFEKRPLASNQKEVQSFKHHFEIELILFEQLQLYCFKKQPIFTRESMEM